MTVKELLNKIENIKSSIPGLYDDAEVLVYNKAENYCEIIDVGVDGKDRIAILLCY